MNSLFRSQWRVIKQDKWLFSSLTWIPVLLSLSIWWIFSQGIARDLPIGVVDLQHSELSRQLIHNIDATSALNVFRIYPDSTSAKNELVSNSIYAYVVIPKHTDRDIYLNTPPKVTVFYNSQFILIGKVIKSAMLKAHGTFNVQVSAIKQLAKGDITLQTAIAHSVTIKSQITALFNKNSNYSQFLVSAIVPALWQISIVVSTVLLLTANYRLFGLRKLVGVSPLKSLSLLMAFYFPFFMLQGALFLFCFYDLLAWPMNGSILLLLFIQFITLIACFIMGNFFFFLSLDSARAMSMAGAFTAPSFAFMGVTFPVSDMNPVAQIWRNLLPISHYIEAQINQASYGLNAWQTLQPFLLAMLGYSLPLLLVLLLVKKHLRLVEYSTGGKNETNKFN